MIRSNITQSHSYCSLAWKYFSWCTCSTVCWTFQVGFCLRTTATSPICVFQWKRGTTGEMAKGAFSSGKRCGVVCGMVWCVWCDARVWSSSWRWRWSWSGSWATKTAWMRLSSTWLDLAGQSIRLPNHRRWSLREMQSFDPISLAIHKKNKKRSKWKPVAPFECHVQRIVLRVSRARHLGSQSGSHFGND